MSRPFRPMPLAPKRGLVMGNAIAQGLNNAMKNYAQMQMQRSQMKFRNDQMTMNQILRQKQMAEAQQKMAPADHVQADLLTSRQKDKTGLKFSPDGQSLYNPGAVNAMISAHGKDVYPDGVPDAVKTNWKVQAQKGLLPAEFDKYAHADMNPQTERLYQAQMQNETKLDSTRAVQDSLAERTRLTQEGLSDRTNSLVGGRDRTSKVNALSRQMVALTNARAKLNSGGGMFGQMDPTAKELAGKALDDREKEYRSQLADHLLSDDEDGGADAPTVAPAARGADSSGSTGMPKLTGRKIQINHPSEALPAQPGDILMGNGGKKYIRLPGVHSDGSANIAPISSFGNASRGLASAPVGPSASGDPVGPAGPTEEPFNGYPDGYGEGYRRAGPDTPYTANGKVERNFLQKSFWYPLDKKKESDSGPYPSNTEQYGPSVPSDFSPLLRTTGLPTQNSPYNDDGTLERGDLMIPAQGLPGYYEKGIPE